MRLGQAVFAPFGSRLLQGIVVGETDTPPEQEARPVEAVADPEPVLDAPHRALARWLSDHYLAPLWECVTTCLPSGYGQRSVTVVSPVDVPLLLPSDPADQRVLRYLAENGQTALDTLREALGQVPMDLLRRLQDSGHLTVAQGLARPAGRPRMERRVALAAEPEFARRHARELAERAPRSVAARILERLAEARDTTLTEIRELGAQRRHLDDLAEEGWLREYEARVERDPIAERRPEPLPPATLTEEQAAVVEAISAAPGEYLLHGVNGVGEDRGVPRTGAAGAGGGEGRDRARPRDLADAAGDPALRRAVPGGGSRCCTPASARASCTTSGTASSGGRRGWWWGRAARCSRRCGTSGWSCSTRSTSGPTSRPTRSPATTPATPPPSCAT